MGAGCDGKLGVMGELLRAGCDGEQLRAGCDGAVGCDGELSLMRELLRAGCDGQMGVIRIYGELSVMESWV